MQGASGGSTIGPGGGVVGGVVGFGDGSTGGEMGQGTSRGCKRSETGLGSHLEPTFFL